MNTVGVCRTCLAKISITSEKGVACAVSLDSCDDYELSPLQIMFRFTKLQIDVSDGLTNAICLKCWRTLKQFHEFYKKAINAQTALNLPKCNKELTSTAVERSKTKPEKSSPKVKNVRILPKLVLPDKSKAQGNIMLIPKENVNQVENKTNDTDDKKSSTNLQPIVENKTNHTANTCNACNKSYIRKQDLLNHAKICSLYCPHCKIKIIDGNEMKSHIEICKANELTCKICNKLFQSRPGLKYHVESHHGESLIPCKNCNRSFKTKNTLRKHLVAMHSESKPHECGICGLRFATAIHIQRHVAGHNNDRHHQCSACGKLFYQISHLKQHMYSHSDVKHFTCPYCYNNYSRKNTLIHHVKNHHGSKLEDIKKYKFVSDAKNLDLQPSNSEEETIHQLLELDQFIELTNLTTAIVSGNLDEELSVIVVGENEIALNKF